MAGRRPYNEKRSELNVECREKLSQQLRIRIEPSQVRLKTENTDDPYTWEVTDDIKDVFDKNFSDLSTGALMKLSKELDADDENLRVVAVSKPTTRYVIGNREFPGFKVKIKELQAKNDQMSEEIREWKARAESESQKRVDLQKEIDRLQNTITHVEMDKDSIQQQLNEWKITADYLRECTTQCHEAAVKMLNVLEI